MLQGALHLHSTYSDGDLSLRELRAIYIESGCRFACVTDHADAFLGDAAKLDAYRSECELLSDEQFRLIGGLEYTCVDRMHVLGYGVTSLIDSTDPEDVITRIGALGGLAVVAHPKDDAFATIEAFSTLPAGIEVWNSKYDGRYAPRAGTFALLRRLRRRSPYIRAFYGQDLHWRRQYRALFTCADCETPERADVLAALAAGRYAGMKGELLLPSDGTLSAELLATFEHVNARSQSLRRALTAVNRGLRRLGLGVPRPLKAHLRRLF
jgi:hypothetical protein